MQRAFRSKKVFITAINSFTGFYLEKNLRNFGYEVYGSVSNPAEHPEHYHCDITQKDTIKEVLHIINPDYIIHLAGITFVPHSDIKQIYDVNLFGAVNLLDVCIQEGINPEKIIIPSSANVYGNPDKEIIDESVCPMPVNHYANSKLAMEHIVRTYFNKIPIIITRPFNYTGVGQPAKFVIPKIVAHFKDKKPSIELGNIDVIRDFSDVRFVADIYRRLLESPVSSDVFNICSSKGVSLTEILQICSKISGHSLEVKINPDFVRKNEIKVLTGDNSRLKKAVGELNPVSMDYTLRWMLEN